MRISCLALVVPALFAVVACSSPTSSSNKNDSTTTTTTTTSTTSTVYQITGTASANKEAQIEFALPTALPSGVTVTGAKLTYAVDSTYVASSAGHPGWGAGSSGTWVANFASDPSTAGSWLSDTCSATINAAGVAVAFWMNSGHVYLKELDLTMSDSSTQKVTFSTATNPEHSVYTPVSGSASTEDLAFSWTYFDSSFTSLTTDVTTVSF
jgi:hypothetical protein